MTREELEKTFTYHMAHAAIEFSSKYVDKSVDSSDVCEGFEAGAEWARKFIIKRACEWLESAIRPYAGYSETSDIVDAFQKAMEE